MSTFRNFTLILVIFAASFESFAVVRKTTTWMGYVGPYTGNLGAVSYFGVRQANNNCNATYSGSHACRYKEIRGLGTAYPFTQNAWVVDGMRKVGDLSGMDLQSVDGYWSYRYFQGGVPANGPNCAGFTGGTSAYWGVVMHTNGYLVGISCDGAYYLPCCK